MQIITTIGVCVFVCVLLMYGVLCVRLDEHYRSPKDDVLTQSTADTYHKELETLTAILANRVKQLLPDENTKKTLHHRKKKTRQVVEDIEFTQVRKH